MAGDPAKAHPNLTTDDVNYPKGWNVPKRDKNLYTGTYTDSTGKSYEALHDGLGNIVNGLFKAKGAAKPQKRNLGDALSR
jgi:hypothetical protein